MGFKVFEYGVANNQKNGPYFEFFRNGQVRRKEFYVENLRSGNSTSYYENGNLRIQSSFYEDKLDGTIKHYYSNGNLMWKGDYVKGHMAGERIYYNEDGNPINGAFIIKGDKGNTEREGTCVDGRPEGELKIYTEEGTLTILSNFKHGLPDGLTSFYGADQKLMFTQLYKNGRFKKETRLNPKKQ
jgi:antitoxin component YwqK of YwqJK toxin-antitoxin module